MEQGNGDNDNAVVWSRDEREVAEFLLEMRRVILDFDSDLKLPFQWGRKRKRSAIKVSTSSSSRRGVLRNNNGGGSDGAGGDCGGGDVVAAEKKKKVKVEASSPATPLSLSLTESDEKNTNNNNNDKPLRTKASLKKKKDYYVKTNEDLTERNVELNQVVDKVSRYREELKAYLLMLKQRKQELRNGPKMEPKNPISQIGSQMQQQQLVNTSNSMAQNQNQHQNNNHHHQQQQVFQVPNTPQRLRINQNSGAPQSNLLLPMQQPSNPSSSSSIPHSESLTLVNNPTSTSGGNMGKLGGGVVLDLNVSPEELVHVEPYQPLDVNMNRVMAARARQRRIQINRLKNNPIGNNNNNNSKPRYSCRA